MTILLKVTVKALKMAVNPLRRAVFGLSFGILTVSMAAIINGLEDMDLRGILIFFIYAVLFMGVLAGVLYWDKHKRLTRKPFGEDVKLLRMPGQYLLGRVIESDASYMQWVFGLMVVPVLAGCLVLQIAAHFSAKSPLGLVLAVVVFALVLLVCIWSLVARLKRCRDDYLGFFGERIVADCLESLKEKGWFIFHDLQCDGATGKFNLDHVAVGPSGIWAIETKCWRKRRARPGFKDHELTFDGSKIICPWGDETDAIKQAADNANWLQKWLQTRLGKTFDISAVLAFPGYFVTERKLGAVRLTNPKNLPSLLTGRDNAILNAAEIDLVRRQLEAQCRDVEY